MYTCTRSSSSQQYLRVIQKLRLLLAFAKEFGQATHYISVQLLLHYFDAKAYQKHINNGINIGI